MYVHEIASGKKTVRYPRPPLLAALHRALGIPFQNATFIEAGVKLVKVYGLAQALGFWLGFILGPIGIIIAATLADERFKCPECGGAVVPGKPRCKNCGADIPIPTSASIPRPRIVRPTPRIRTPMKAQGEP